MWLGKLSEKQQDFLADKLMDTANWGIGVLGFGQIAAPNIRFVELTLGLIFYLWALLFTLRLKKRR